MQPRPTTLPSITNTSVSKAKCVSKLSAYGKKYISSKMRSLSSHLVKRLTRLSNWGPSGDLRGDVRQLGALATHNAADKRSQSVEMPGEVPLGGSGIALREGMAYGTIASEVVTHRRLLHMCFFFNREYTMRQPLKRPFHNDLEKCTVVNVFLNWFDTNDFTFLPQENTRLISNICSYIKAQRIFWNNFFKKI